MKTMKKTINLIVLLLTAAILFTLTGCGDAPSGGEAPTQAAESSESKPADPMSTAPQAPTQNAEETEATDAKTLVVYFSATGTTRGVAEQIAAVTGADTYEILAAQPYTADDLNWNDSDSRTTHEQNDPSVRPAIAGETISLDAYDVIFIGYPIWWGEEPRIMDTFVESYDFSGKTMIPFCTSGSSGIGSSWIHLEENAGSGNWLEGERLSGQSDIEDWIDDLDL